VWQTLEMSAP